MIDSHGRAIGSYGRAIGSYGRTYEPGYQAGFNDGGWRGARRLRTGENHFGRDVRSLPECAVAHHPAQHCIAHTMARGVVD